MFTGQALKTIVLMSAALAVVALGTNEFVHRHRQVVSQIETEQVQKLAQGLRGQNNFEEVYRQMQVQTQDRPAKEETELSKDIKKLKSWLASKLSSSTESYTEGL